MLESEFARFLTESIYVLWFHVFTNVMPIYKAHSKELIGFGRKLFFNI